MYLLSKLYASGQSVTQDPVASQKYLLDAAEHGHALAAAQVGIQNVDSPEPSEAAKWLETALKRAAKEAGFLPEHPGSFRTRELALARYHLAKLLLDGKAVGRNVPRAIELLDEASGQDCADATNKLAELYHGGEGVPRDDAKAVKLYEAAAAGGVGSAAYQLAEAYTLGWASERSTSIALGWYRRSAALGFPAAWFALGRAYEEADGVPRDNNEALTWYQVAGNNNVVAAQLRLGDIARLGELGQPRNGQVALRWYRLAADRGEPLAEEKIGDLYWEGSGDLARDRTEAVAHYGIAANHGIALAERKLAIAYANGDGVPADDVLMLQWARKSAERGDPVAAGLLGYSILIGLDGTYDFVEAATCLALAAENTHSSERRVKAAIYAKDVQSRLTASEREAFHTRLARWRSTLDEE